MKGILEKFLLSVLTLFFTSFFAISEESSSWYGFEIREFAFEGKDAKIVFPEIPNKNKDWVWRARFWGHEPQTDIALLEKGFHLVWIDIGDLYGSPEAVDLWNRYYDYIQSELDLNPKVVLEGMSRGGLIVYNWAAENTDKVACIYADAPVCDINSWPGGKGLSNGSPEDWEKCLEAYSLNDTSAKDFNGIPIYTSKKVAEAGIPVLHVCGTIDEVVPMEENTYALEKVFKEAEGSIRIIAKEGVGHHPHSLKDPSPIVAFILKNTSPELLPDIPAYYSFMEINNRQGLQHCKQIFAKGEEVQVAFLGGSITYGKGWRVLVCDYLQKEYPHTNFNFINAGIPSMGSTPGAMRLKRDVFSNGKIDLLFVEAAVNDATNGRSGLEMLRGMEGIIRHARILNPEIDIVMMHFADLNKLADYNNDRIPEVIIQHEKVAAYYGTPSINFALEVNNRILNGQFSWRDDFIDLHPSPFGHDLYFKTIKYLLENQCPAVEYKDNAEYNMTKIPLDSFSYFNGDLISVFDNADKMKGFKYIKKWSPVPGENTREGFVNSTVLEALEPGSECRFKFSGRAVGIFVTAGPDAGKIEYSIDGSAYRQLDQFTQWSSFLHLPWLYMLESELVSGNHELIIRTLDRKNEHSKGYACRIHFFAVNE